jgi:predicted nucleic acid-binding protein
MSKFFIVVDNNILISRLLLPNSLPAAAVRLALNEGIILISESLILLKE